MEELKIWINKYLDECQDGKTPFICNSISTKEGRDKVVQQVVNLVAKEEMSIAEAVMDIEKDFCNNKCEN